MLVSVICSTVSQECQFKSFYTMSFPCHSVRPWHQLKVPLLTTPSGPDANSHHSIPWYRLASRDCWFLSFVPPSLQCSITLTAYLYSDWAFPLNLHYQGTSTLCRAAHSGKVRQGRTAKVAPCHKYMWMLHRHAVQCCVAYKFDRQIVGPIKRSRAAFDE